MDENNLTLGVVRWVSASVVIVVVAITVCATAYNIACINRGYGPSVIAPAAPPK